MRVGHHTFPELKSPVMRAASSSSSGNPQPNPDRVEFSGDEGRKVYGSIGAMAGALSSRVLVPCLAAAGLAMAAPAVGLGTAGAVVGGALGLALGIKAEWKYKLGRFVGGMLGGTVGSALGALADRVGLKPSATLAQECRGFSLKSLPGKLWNSYYTSHKKLNHDQVNEALSHLQPGDILVTNEDGDFMMEAYQRLGGGRGDWTHNFIADHDGQVMHVSFANDEPKKETARSALKSNHHAKILRPNYTDDASRDRTLNAARDQLGQGVRYDGSFNLKDDEKQYCQEYTYKALAKGSPEIRLETRKVFGLMEIVGPDEFDNSPDMTEVWSSDRSNFWLNWLSHYN